MTTSSCERGCGTRQKGGIYIETLLGSGGLPLEAFLIEPPIPVDMDALGASSIGVKLIEIGGVTHVLDWIGETHYPNVADFVEEARSMGLSRRVSRRLDFSRLTPESRLLVVHRKALVANWEHYRAAVLASGRGIHWDCPKKRHDDAGGAPGACIGTWWHDVEGYKDQANTADPAVVRRVGSTTYTAYRRPAGLVGRYEAAIFGRFPISRLAVIKDPEGFEHEAATRVAVHSKLPVSLEEA